ncbi:MAG: tRNA threonylcarbamoyladenosine dehydratase [Ahniella sp.]|nr:tRNA threonylcarbamoyladenosine dehydratase [Ahniella sp.]
MSEPTPIDPRFAGIDRLYGAGSVARLSGKHVIVIGLGGVGSWAVEALARTAVGTLTLVDADDVCVSNVNRQLIALTSTVGQSKAAVLAARLREINPAIVVNVVEEFLTPSNMERLISPPVDFVLDACDAFRVKVELAVFCRRRKIPLLMSGSAGGRADPTKITIRDLARTEQDALLSLIRKKLRDEFGWPRNKDRYFGIQAVYSLENVRYPKADGTVCGIRPEQNQPGRIDCDMGLGAATAVTASFGLFAAARVIEKLLIKA